MKNPQPTLQNDFLLKSKENSCDIKLLGFAQIIGYDIRKIYEGKRLYRNYKELLNSYTFNMKLLNSEETFNILNELLNKSDKNNINLTKFIYNVDSERWEYKDINYEENHEKYQNNNKNSTKKKNDVLTKVEFALLQSRVNEKSSSETEKIYQSIKKINIWIDEYLNKLNLSSKKYPELAGLLKQLISK